MDMSRLRGRLLTELEEKIARPIGCEVPRIDGIEERG